ncbi:type II secretion system protein E [Desulforamulus reducens MI-1]|uniref:Type II secretion system protein E n=1 Tax=Desulforamulus reducens (strain ATCC BAA-1160 / DSM 100696 / MI-1) TaxID=349161 RepID=A4J3A4_DESRM|nr:GspE/PulE family protein [Desulforamulus reducens]ABO49557.1 type II secretion system protein E [Desulforamulus reducens MI-1]
MLTVAPKSLIGNILLEKGAISQQQLREALNNHRQTDQPLGQVLVDLGYVTKKQVSQYLDYQEQMEEEVIHIQEIDKALLKLFSEQILRRYKIFPLFKKGNKLTVAMAEPANVIAIDDLKVISNLDIVPVEVQEQIIELAIDLYYDITKREVNDKEQRLVITDEEEVPIIQLVYQIIDRAIDQGASDIHIEPQEKRVRIRYRIDGMLILGMELAPTLDKAIISRIKIMSQLNIAEKRVPQDGRIQYGKQSRNFDLRVSTMPTVYGEKAVIRILNPESIKKYQLAQLGFSAYNLKSFQKCLRATSGMVLITGPTGCGKTTTLYAILNELNLEDRNFSTIEDPVEYRLEGINQTQVNTKTGMTFAVGLRALLRQDPDIIMVGEIRDRETAEIAVTAAGTGHLVFSTLHTNDALGALDRLIHMGLEIFQVASSVLVVVAQRLVRKLCPYCKEGYLVETKSPEYAFLQSTPWQDHIFYKAKGCVHCNFIGYRGRMAIQEVLQVNGNIRKLLVERAPSGELKKAALQGGMTTLKTDGIEKALQGLTSIPEVMRVAYSDEE